MSKTGLKNAPVRRIAPKLEMGATRTSLVRGAGLILLFTIFCYWPVLRAGFIWDDDTMLTQNPFVRYPLGLLSIWFSTELPDYYPLTSSSFWLEWRFWGERPMGYHVVNVLLHGMSACLLWRVLKAMRLPGAWLAALIFAVHPINVQSVAWIAERKNTLCMVFFLLSVLWYLRFENKDAASNVNQRLSRWYWLSLVAFLCALLSKTAVVMLPVVLLALAWWRNSGETNVITNRQLLLRLAPFFGLSLVLGLVTVWFQSHRAIGEVIIRTDSFPTRLAVAGQAFWFYLGKTLAPIRLSFVYPEWKIQAGTLMAWLPLAAMVVAFAICWVFRQKWGRAALVALSYFLLMLLPILGFVNVYFQRYSLVADHWTYFASLGLVVSIVSGGAHLFGRLKSGIRWSLPVAALAILGWFSAATWLQAHVYHDSETLWKDTLAKNPNCSLAHNSLGSMLADAGQPEAARLHFERALASKPESVELLNNLASALLDQGKPMEAIPHLEKALKIAPRSAMALYNLGNAYDQMNQSAEAEANYRRALEADPNHARARSNLGCLLYAAGKRAEAIEEFTQAITLDPTYAEALNNLAVIFLETGRAAQAESLLRDAVRSNPNYADGYFNLGNALLSQGSSKEAVEAYRRALELRENPLARARLGTALWQSGDSEGALQELADAMKLQPELAEAHYQAALILSGQKKTQTAITFFRQAIQFQPEWPEALAGLAFLLASASDASQRDPAEALSLATRAVELTGSTNIVALDALAAASAENGKFVEAARLAGKAIELAEAGAERKRAAGIQVRKNLYEAGKPYHE